MEKPPTKVPGTSKSLLTCWGDSLSFAWLGGCREQGKSVGSARKLEFIVAIALVTSCASTTQSEPDATTTVASIATSTTIPVSNLDIRIDPTSPDRANADIIVQTLHEMERDYPVKPGTLVVLYSKTDASVAWAKEILHNVNCFERTTEDALRGFLGLGNACGLAMRLDKEPACYEVEFCRTRRFVAAHEFFHVVQYQLFSGEMLWFTSWLWEGAADYVGYSYAYGKTPGQLTHEEIEALRSNLKDFARDPHIEGGLSRMQVLINGSVGPNPLPRWRSYLYNKAFLAVTLLIDKFGSDSVLFDYVRKVGETRDFEKSFELVFGVSQDDFSTEFETWLETL